MYVLRRGSKKFQVEYLAVPWPVKNMNLMNKIQTAQVGYKLVQ